jgi:TonB family protein
MKSTAWSPGAVCCVTLALVAWAFPSLSAGQAARASVAGIVVDSVGSPVVGAHVTVEGTELYTQSDAGGRFRLNEVGVGRVEVRVRRIGFRAASVPIDLTETGATQLMITLAAIPEVLAAVEVTARPEVFDARLAGFEARAAKRKNGHFISRERIERTNSKRLSDLLRQVPTVRVRMVRGQGMMAYIRGASCPPVVYIDGSPANAGPFDLDLIDLVTVEGIEVYGGFGAPAEFSSVRADQCGVIAIWSRPFRPRERAPEVAEQASLITALVQLEHVYEAKDVDSIATPIAGSIQTQYPSALFEAGVAGTATVRFIVDTSGVVEMSTLEITASHDLFAQAARQALSGARFTPAFLGGRRVRQVVALPFRFSPPRAPRGPATP